ncbi:MAG: Uncharacterised protein [Flavobacteriia bacterium]|nr:MAG: Uncharacterised protein [Flavobacteriia bacterium]
MDIGIILKGRDHARHRTIVVRVERLHFLLKGFAQLEITFFDQIVDHALQPHGPAVVRTVDTRYPIGHQFLDLLRQDDAASSAEYFDVLGPCFLEQIDHEFEVLIVTALVGSHGNGLRIFLYRGMDHFLYAAVVSEMDHFTARRLNDAPHDVDGCIVAIEQ